MSNRHYVLLATDGLIHLPLDGKLNTDNRKDVYIFGFAGGLLEVDGIPVEGNEYLNYKDPANWEALMGMKGNAIIPSPMIWGEVGEVGS